MANLLRAKPTAAWGLAWLVWGGLLGSAAAVVADRIVAVVNDDLITASEVTAFRESLGGIDVLGEMIPSLKERSSGSLSFPDKMEQLITERLLLQEAKTQGVNATEEEAKSLLTRLDKQRGVSAESDSNSPEVVHQLQDLVKIAKLISREVDSKLLVSADEIEGYYHRHSDRFALPARVHVRQIFFKTAEDAPPEQVSAQRAAAERTVADLQQGADFATLAKERSESPEAKKGGDLGYFGPGELLPTIDQAVTALPVGGMSGVIQSPIGFHIVRLEEKQTGRVRSFQEVKSQVEELFYQERSAELYRKWIRQLRARAYVEIK